MSAKVKNVTTGVASADAANREQGLTVAQALAGTPVETFTFFLNQAISTTKRWLAASQTDGSNTSGARAYAANFAAAHLYLSAEVTVNAQADTTTLAVQINGGSDLCTIAIGAGVVNVFQADIAQAVAIGDKITVTEVGGASSSGGVTAGITLTTARA